MTPKQRKTVKVSLIILAISMAVMAVSTIISIIHSGWATTSIINFVPFIGILCAMIAIYGSDKKKNDK